MPTLSDPNLAFLLLIQLRHLQTLVEKRAEKNTTVIFPVPVDLLAGLTRSLATKSES